MRRVQYIVLLSAALLYTSFSHLLAQEVMLEQSLNSDHLEWFHGSITRNDGTVMKGLVKYNDKNSALSFESGDQSMTLTSRMVTSFEYMDEARNTYRQFLALDYEDTQTGAKRPVFFELLREFKSFAVLTKADPIVIQHYDNNLNSRQGVFDKTMKVEQTETIYIIDQNGKIEPYCKVINKEIDGTFMDRSKTKNKMVDSDVLKKQIAEPDWLILTDYAKQQHLSFKKKDDLLKILDHYQELINR